MKRDPDALLRKGLLAPVDPAASTGLCLVSVLCFIAAAFMKTLTLLSGASLPMHLAACLVIGLPMLIAAVFIRQLSVRENKNLTETGLMLILCAGSMVARLCFLDHVSSDYSIYLSDWLAKFGSLSFTEAMRAGIGEYNVLYQYILFLLTRLPIPALYGVKAVSMIGDALIFGAALHLAGNGKKTAPLACILLLIPTGILNSAMFAQCDSLYTACALWGLVFALDNRPSPSAICFALSVAFKLQAVFLLPVAALLWADRRLTVADAGKFLLTLAAVMLPALIAGKSLGDIFRIYTAQTGLYTGLNYGAANLFGLMETAGLNAYAYGTWGMMLAAGAVCALFLRYLPKAGRLTVTDYVSFELLCVLLMVFLLPRMHERYFYAADMLAVILALRCRKAVPAALMIQLASFSVYLQTAVPLSEASGLMLLSICWLLMIMK